MSLGVLQFIKASLVQHVRYRRKTRTRDALQGRPVTVISSSGFTFSSCSEQEPFRESLSSAWKQCGASVLNYYNFESQQGLLCIKPKTRNTTRVGVKENVGLYGIPPSVGSLCASVCYFRWSPELDDVNICKLLPPFFLTIKRVLLLLTINQ